ncbi:hypothetical protein [Salipiger mucosus]|uniref:Uncharacterized protein n=1 Tax=Salipiger mucosus DSM 16094 TaxID=1123237 RepID=S9SKA3_9RHOB|nr:hypothetical protein [Salipiger mucosus]EPX86809.1 hypothetical protein Salmuc_01458 [Salipiger mucosus DSM 16094]
MRLAGCLVLLSIALLSVPTAQAATPARERWAPFVVGDDPGGRLRPRLELVARLRASGRRVEIRGRYCHSACTVYLGARNVCVSPRTRFGFHGPYYRSGPIVHHRFDHWSRAMAAHYPAPLRRWFMRYARFLTDDQAILSGAELIRMGVPRC